MQKVNDLGRRAFNSMLLAFLAFGSMAAKGCDSVLSEIQTWVPIGISAVGNLLNLLGSFGVIPVGAGTAAAMLLSSITTIFNDVLADIQAWNANPTNSTLQKIQAELQSISGQLSAFVASLTIPNAKWAQLVAALLGLILSTLAGYISQLAQKIGSTASAAASAVRTKVMMQSGPVVVVEPIKRKPEQFKKEYNADLDAAGFSTFEI